MNLNRKYEDAMISNKDGNISFFVRNRVVVEKNERICKGIQKDKANNPKNEGTSSEGLGQSRTYVRGKK